ncbi:MAG: hypothetical protein HN348_21860, partial [Proteobacteria bacterium]|nr:hypothetical protein [Pseudomonadota bacterium]
MTTLLALALLTPSASATNIAGTDKEPTCKYASLAAAVAAAKSDGSTEIYLYNGGSVIHDTFGTIDFEVEVGPGNTTCSDFNWGTTVTIDGDGDRVANITGSSADVRFENLILRDGSEINGGVIRVRNGAWFDGVNLEIKNGTASNQGGCAMVTGTDTYADFFDTLFNNCDATGTDPGEGGGALAVVDGAHGGTSGESIIQNSTALDGAGVYASGATTQLFLNGDCALNVASNDGGCAYVD